MLGLNRAYLSIIRINLATKASRWKMTFCKTVNGRFASRFMAITHASHANAVLVESRPLDNLGLESVINLRHQLESEGLGMVSSWVCKSDKIDAYLQNSCCRNTVSEQIVQLCSDKEYPRRCVLCNDVVGDLGDQCFPVWWRYGRFLVDLLAVSCQKMFPDICSTCILLLCMYSLVHEKRSSQIASTVLCDFLLQRFTALVSFLRADLVQDSSNILFSGSSDPNKQCSTPDGRNNVTSAVCQEDQSQVRTVFLHRSSQCSLCISSEMVGFVDDNDLETLLRG